MRYIVTVVMKDDSATNFTNVAVIAPTEQEAINIAVKSCAFDMNVLLDYLKAKVIGTW